MENNKTDEEVTMAKKRFKKGKKYYLPEDDADIRFIEQDLSEGFIFRYIKHAEFFEYSTRDGSEVYESRRAFKSL